MSSREQVTVMLNQVEQGIRDLEVAYEHYFSGIEKRSPEQKRQEISRVFRKLLTAYIPQNDLKFKLKTLSSRFQSYCGYWDRILRQIDEGRYERHVARIQRQTSAPSNTGGAVSSKANQPASGLYEQLVSAHESCAMKAPNREQVDKFIAKQQAVIREKFGDRKVDFKVVTEGGKPKIKVFARN